LNPVSLKQCSLCGTDRPDSAGKEKRQQSGHHLGERKGGKEELPKKKFLDVGPIADTNKRSHSADNRVTFEIKILARLTDPLFTIYVITTGALYMITYFTTSHIIVVKISTIATIPS
jgi:hypothetical protein